MKRPLATTGFSMLIALFALSKLNNLKAIGIVFLATLIALLVFIAVKPLRKYTAAKAALLAVLVGTTAFYISFNRYNAAVNYYDTQKLYVSGELSRLPYTDYGKYYYVIQTDEIDSLDDNLTIRLVSSTELDFEPGDRITAKVRFFRLGGTGESYLEYYKSQKMFLGATVLSPKNAAVEKNAVRSLRSLLLRLRATITRTVTDYCEGDAAGVICALLLGEKNSLSDRVQTDFRNCGISHLFAVSGLHLCLWTMLVEAILKRMKIPSKAIGVLSIGFCVFFMLLTGFNPPVVRAGFMLICVFAASFFSREADSFNSIGLAITVMLLINPFAAVSVSLWLSVLATTAILTCVGPMSDKLMKPFLSVRNKYVKKTVKYLISLISVTVCTTCFTLPVYVFVFGSMSLLGLPSNLLMVSVGAVCMALSGFASLLLTVKLVPVGGVLMKISGMLANLLIHTADMLSGFRFALIDVSGTASKIVLAATALVALVFLIAGIRSKKLVGAAAALCACAFIAVNVFGFIQNYNRLNVCVCNSTKGLGVIACSKGRSAVLYCNLNSYGATTLNSCARRMCITNADRLFVADESGNWSNLVGECLRVEPDRLGTDMQSTRLGDATVEADGQRTVINFYQTKIVILFSDDIILDSNDADIVIDAQYAHELDTAEYFSVCEDGSTDYGGFD